MMLGDTKQGNAVDSLTGTANAESYRMVSRAVIGLVILAASAVSFTISFGAFVYSGPLAGHLSQGIGLALLGVIAMPVIVALTSSYSGTVCHAQDVPTILIAGSALTIASSLATQQEALFPTVATLVGVTAVASGLALLAAGYLRLGALARLIPYPVVGGFLASTGFLLTTGALSMMVRDHVSVWHLAPILSHEALLLYGPWLAFSVITVCATRYFESDMTLPACLVLAGVAFYATLGLLGINLEDAGQMGLLLGPFESTSFLEGLTPSLITQARWDLIASELPTILAAAAMAILGLLLNASGLEIAMDQEFDLERDLTSVGSANIAAGMTGGFVGYHLLGETLFANRMGLTGASTGIVLAASAAVTLLFGASVIGAFPVGLAAMVIAYLGLDLLYEWLVIQRRRLPMGDMLIIALILATAATFGFVESLTVGLLTATTLFVISYASIDVVQLRASGASRRSSVERAPAHMARLTELGETTRIYTLGGFLFFGTAAKLLDTVRTDIASPPRPDRIMFDLGRITGLDSSAKFSLQRIADLCSRTGVEFILGGIPCHLAGHLDDIAQTRVHPSFDDALISVEDALLAADHGQELDHISPILDRLAKDHPDLDVSVFLARTQLRAEEFLIREGDPDNVIYQLISGRLRAEVNAASGDTVVIAHILPGAFVGEIAFYAEAPRTAAVIAETDAEVVRIEIDKIPNSLSGRAAAAELHQHAAQVMAQRLMRMTRLFRDAGI